MYKRVFTGLVLSSLLAVSPAQAQVVSAVLTVTGAEMH
jgi:hypothetical protein